MNNNFKPIFNTQVLNQRVTKVLSVVLLSGLVVSAAGCFAKPKGTVQISSSPTDLRIFVDGKIKGNTPSTEDGSFTLELVEGNHKIEAVSKVNDFEERFAFKEVLVTENTLQSVHLVLGFEIRVSEEGYKNRITFLEACNQGAVDKCKSLASHYQKDKDNVEHIALSNTLYGTACEANDWPSCNVLASNYASGIGFDINLEKANVLDLKSCDADYFPACTSLGVRYLSNPEIKDNLNAARALFERSCAGGDMKGCTDLGVTYLDGKKKDPAKASKILKQACDDTSVRACNMLGSFLEKTDLPASKLLYLKGCELGSARSCEGAKRIEAEEKKRKAAAIRRAQKAKMGNCVIGGTVYYNEEWSSTTSSGNVFADAFFGAATKETFVIVYEGVVKAVVGDKAEVIINDYGVKQTKGGGFLQPRTFAKNGITEHADKRLGKTQFYNKSVCDK